jgi:hypothetical protein
VRNLKSSHIKFKYDESCLIWPLNALGEYTPKEGYKALCSREEVDQSK